MSIGAGAQGQQGTGGNDFQAMLQKFARPQAGGQPAVSQISQRVAGGQGRGGAQDNWGNRGQGGTPGPYGGGGMGSQGQGRRPVGAEGGGAQSQAGEGTAQPQGGSAQPRAGWGSGQPQGQGGGAQAQPGPGGAQAPQGGGDVGQSAYKPMSSTGLQSGMNAGGSGGQHLPVGQAATMTPEGTAARAGSFWGSNPTQGAGGPGGAPTPQPGLGAYQQQQPQDWQAQFGGAQAQPGGSI